MGMESEPPQDSTKLLPPSITGELQMWEGVYEQGKDVWSASNALGDVVTPELFGRLTGGGEGLQFFLPLCGRSPDIMWLVSRGHRVTGVEWSERAIAQFFTENKLDFGVEENVSVGSGKGVVYRAKGGIPVVFYRCDFFDVCGDAIGRFDCIWDMGSITSIKSHKRPDYVDIVSSLLKPSGRMLLSSVDFDEGLHPHMTLACSAVEVQSLYSDCYIVELAQREGKDSAMRSFCNPLSPKIFPLETLPYFSWDFYLLTPKP